MRKFSCRPKNPGRNKRKEIWGVEESNIVHRSATWAVLPATENPTQVAYKFPRSTNPQIHSQYFDFKNVIFINFQRILIKHLLMGQTLNTGNEKVYITCCAESLSCLTLCDHMDCSPPGSSVHEDSPGKNTGVDCYALLQGISPPRGSNTGLPHYRQILYHWATWEAQEHWSG